MTTEWISPEHSRKKVNKAGQRLIGDGRLSLDEAMEILSNWRSSHSFPLNTLAMDLRKKAQKVNARPILGQRLKRATSIRRKLQRTPRMMLSRMQDIGGCRAVLLTYSDVLKVVDLYSRSRAAHERVRLDDYTQNPPESGYRGVHLVYRFRSQRSPNFDNLCVEVQLRSRLQHAWATAVETVGALRREDLKAGEGDPAWLRFFLLSSGAFAHLEETSPPPGTPAGDRDLRSELADLARRLDVEQELLRYRAALRVAEDPSASRADYFVLVRPPGETSLKIYGFRERDVRRAYAEYLRQETQPSLFTEPSPEGGAVLVAASSLAQVRRAYPNYFSDTEHFLKQLRPFLSGSDAPPPNKSMKQTTKR